MAAGAKMSYNDPTAALQAAFSLLWRFACCSLAQGMPFKMRRTGVLSVVAAACCLLFLPVFFTSCSRSPLAGRKQPAARVLSPTEAAQLAAKLANEECERLYKRRPFAASQHGATLQDGKYHWGGLDVGAPGGYSADVTFGQDGSGPKVEVYFSSDQLRPRPVPPTLRPNIPKR